MGQSQEGDGGVKQYICDHSPVCTNPKTYFRSRVYGELFDENGNLTEIIPSDDEPIDCICTECGELAELKEYERVMEPAEQGKMIRKYPLTYSKRVS